MNQLAFVSYVRDMQKFLESVVEGKRPAEAKAEAQALITTFRNIMRDSLMESRE